LRLAASRGRIDSAYWTGEVVGTLLVLALMIYFCYAVAFGKKARAFFATRR
jgi:hypothetical protein